MQYSINICHSPGPPINLCPENIIASLYTYGASLPRQTGFISILKEEIREEEEKKRREREEKGKKRGKEEEKVYTRVKRVEVNVPRQTGFISI